MATPIEDLSPREQCVLGGPCAKYPNGVIGIRRLQIAMPDAEGAVRAFATLTGSPGGARTSIRLGPSARSLVTSEQEDEEARHRLDYSGPARSRWGLRPACPGLGEAGPEALTRGSHPGLGVGRWGLKPSSPARDNTVAGTGVARSEAYPSRGLGVADARHARAT